MCCMSCGCTCVPLHEKCYIPELTSKLPGAEQRSTLLGAAVVDLSVGDNKFLSDVPLAPDVPNVCSRTRAFVLRMPSFRPRMVRCQPYPYIPMRVALMLRGCRLASDRAKGVSVASTSDMYSAESGFANRFERTDSGQYADIYDRLSLNE